MIENTDDLGRSKIDRDAVVRPRHRRAVSLLRVADRDVTHKAADASIGRGRVGASMRLSGQGDELIVFDWVSTISGRLSPRLAWSAA